MWRRSLELPHSRNVPAACREQLDPSAGLCLGRERNKPRVRLRLSPTCARTSRPVAAWGRRMPRLHAPDVTCVLHLLLLWSRPSSCLWPVVLRCPCPPGPTAISSLPLTFHECRLVPPRSPGCASPMGHLILRSRSPQPSGLPGDVSDGTLI